MTTMSKRRYKAKTYRKNLQELRFQLINLNIEFYTALKFYYQNPSPPHPEEDIKFINTIKRKIEITEQILKLKLEHSIERQNHQNYTLPPA